MPPAKPINAEREIIRAAKAGDLATVTALLDADEALIGVRDRDGSTLLHCAAWKGHPEVARLLLERGADITLQSENTHYGGTPLHHAAHGNQRAVAELLIRHGADVNAPSGNGRTPLAETAAHNATAVAKLLRAHGASD